MTKPKTEKFKNWIQKLSKHKSAEFWLAFFCLIETSVFFIPSDMILIPMILNNPHKAKRYATISVLFSLIGAVLGWILGHYAFDLAVKPILIFYNYLDTFISFRDRTPLYLIILFIFSSGIVHIPPMKIITLLAGVINFNIGFFLLLSAISRGSRSFLISFFVRKYGQSVAFYLNKKRNIIAIGLIGCLIIFLIGYHLYKT